MPVVPTPVVLDLPQVRQTLEPLTTLPDYIRPFGAPTMMYRVIAGPPAVGGRLAIWSCDTGGYESLGLENAEMAFLYEGSVCLTDETGAYAVGAGEGYLLPKGWCGRFEVIEPVLKVYAAV